MNFYLNHLKGGGAMLNFSARNLIKLHTFLDIAIKTSVLRLNVLNPIGAMLYFFLRITMYLYVSPLYLYRINRLLFNLGCRQFDFL